MKPVETLGNSFILSEKEYEFSEQHNSNYGIYIIEKSNPERNMLIEDIGSITFAKRVREWEWISGQYEVVITFQQENHLAIDSNFIKGFSFQYLNRIQIAFLRTICENGDIKKFESEYACKAKSIATQINGIVDFYYGDMLIDKDLTVKEKYYGALMYILEECAEICD